MGQVTTVTIGTDVFSVYGLTADAPADATSYFNGALGAAAAAWAAATADNRKRALVLAARWMDRALDFSGTKTSSVQPLEWPRDNATCDGTAITSGTVPDDVAKAEFELAGILLVDASKASGTGEGTLVKSVSAGSASVTFFQPSKGTSTDTRVPQPAWDLIKCTTTGAGAAAISTPFVTGGDCSDFDEDDFELSEGFN